jgi:hypothetical protein
LRMTRDQIPACAVIDSVQRLFPQESRSKGWLICWPPA